MEDKLIKIVSEYILYYMENSDQISFDEFIINLTNTIIETLNLQDYAKGIKIKDSYEENPSTRGLVDGESNVCIFRQAIEQSLNNMIEDVPGLSECEIDLLRCLMYIKSIIHEFEHIIQKKLLIEDKENSSFETLIIRLSDEKRDGAMYYCLYEIYPTERLAELKAFRRITKIVKYLETKMDIELLSCYIQELAFFGELCDYRNYGAAGGPTEYFFDFLNSDALSVLREEKSKLQLSLDERILYGVEISSQEYSEKVTEYNVLRERLKTLSSNKKRK